MTRTNLFFKVEIEHDSDDPPERLGEEFRQKMLRFYGVRDVEFSNFTTSES